MLLSAEVLAPSSVTTTISRKTGDLLVQDGPFADTKEQLGGTFVIDVPDLDAAIAWAEKAPSAMYGDVEIRATATRYVHGAWTQWTFPGADGRYDGRCGAGGGGRPYQLRASCRPARGRPIEQAGAGYRAAGASIGGVVRSMQRRRADGRLSAAIRRTSELLR